MHLNFGRIIISIINIITLIAMLYLGVKIIKNKLNNNKTNKEISSRLDQIEIRLDKLDKK